MSTILEVIQNFCYRVNNPAPSAVVGVGSPAEQQYLSLFKFIGDNLRNRPYQWPQLKRGYTFTTIENQRKYQLPGDFYRILESSQWDTTNNWPMRGPISDYNFAVREFAVVSLQTRKAFRLIGPNGYLFRETPYVQKSQGYFEIDPAGANDTDELFLGYLSCNWIWPVTRENTTAYSVGDIRSYLTGDSDEGFVMICIAAGTSGSSYPDVIPTDSEPWTDGTCQWVEYRQPYQIQSSNANLSDNDFCLFDDDLMIEGMRWAWYRAKKQDYQQEREDWEQQVKSAYARFNGPVRVNMCDELSDYFDWPNIPQGSWDV